MKTVIFSILALSGFSIYSQTVTTTTINGSLRVNDSLNVTNNLQAEAITSRGEMVAKEAVYAEKDLFVDGNVSINGKLDVKGFSSFSAGLRSSEIVVGNSIDNTNISMQLLQGGGRALGFGFAGPIKQLPTTCVKPYNSTTLYMFNSRAAVINPISPNMLDFTNDGSNGFIDYGYDTGLYPVPANDTTYVPIPALKINGMCYGNVEIAKGGGYASTGKYLEVGDPVRNGMIAVNVKASGIVGQRTTVFSGYPESGATPPDAYNSQFFVNRNRIKALTVFNTSTNPNGDQTFVVYGSGKTQINASTPGGKYLIINDASNSTSVKERFTVYGNGSVEVNTTATDALTIKDGSVNGNINFKVKNTGHIFAREMQIMAPNMSFPDYVFDKDYKLLNLKELDTYISDHKHLPGFEKAEYYETNGIIASEMFVKQQEKIEELTLYLIELKKEIEELKKKASDH